MNFGKIFLIPTTLGDNDPMEVLPIKVKETIAFCNYFIVENEKTARRFIKKICPEKPQPSLQLFILNKHTAIEEISAFLTPCKSGENIGIISEAGCPGIADPGAEIVALAHQENIEIIPLVGPSSILLSVMASGLNGQSFAFNGYLPIDKNERKNTLKRLERRAKEEKQTQVFIETPFRNDALFQEMLQTLEGSTKLCVACDITLPTQYIRTFPISVWKKQTISFHKRPTIFVIGK
ncbi:MAG: SAM-dependent methyltransferase [Capnocytophaga sp.]|nr:SAM-dependent methyltransferase [Capnocytophaga sp.]